MELNKMKLDQDQAELNNRIELDKKDRDQLLHILIQTRRLTKLAFSTNSINRSEQDIILREVQQATVVLKGEEASV